MTAFVWSVARLYVFLPKPNLFDHSQTEELFGPPLQGADHAGVNDALSHHVRMPQSDIRLISSSAIAGSQGRRENDKRVAIDTDTFLLPMVVTTTQRRKQGINL